MKYKIAVTIQNFVQYYSVQALIDKLSENNIIHIYVPTYKSNESYDNMYNDVYSFLKDKYTVYRTYDKKTRYKIVLEPDNMDPYFIFNYDYKIKYKYFVASSKPQLLYKPMVNLGFDAILCHSTYEQELLSVYALTYLVGRLNYISFKKKTSTNKKTLLYLPTYGVFNTTLDMIDELGKLKDKYNIIIKMHHGTSYLLEEDETRNKLYNAFDEVYDSKTRIEEVLSKADVVLSDNSGAIFDALYNKIPVCIYSNNIEECSYNGIASLQYQLVQEKVIPYTNDVKKVSKIIEECLSSKIISLQNDKSDRLFPLKQSEYLKSNLEVINKFLNDDVNMDRIKFHRVLAQKYATMYFESKITIEALNKRVEELSEENSKLKGEVKYLGEEVNKILNSRCWRITKPLRTISGKISRKG